MTIERCKYILDSIDLPDEVKKKYWKELTDDLEKAGESLEGFSEKELAHLVDTFTDGFIDRSKTMRYARIVTRRNRNIFKEGLRNDPVGFLKELASEVEIQRDVITMKGDFIIRNHVSKMSDNGHRFLNGLMEEDLYGLAKAKNKNPDFIHPDKDLELAYELVVKFDEWDYRMQVMSGVAVDRLKDHLLKYKNNRDLLIEAGMDAWVAHQKKFRKLDLTYGIRATEEEIVERLQKEFKDITKRKAWNSERPNRLMYRGVVMKPGAIIEHNRLYGDGTVYNSMMNTLKRTSNDTALQIVIPLDRGVQRGIDIKNPEPIIQKVVASDELSEIEKAQIMHMLEKSADDQSSAHLLYIVKEAKDYLDELNKDFTELEKAGLQNGKEGKKLSKQIKYLSDKARALELRLSLDPFIGREPNKPYIENYKDYAAESLNVVTKTMTVPVLGRSWVSAIFDAVPQYARNMDIWGSSPKNIPGNLYKAVSKIYHNVSTSEERNNILAEGLHMILNEQDAFMRTLGFDSSLDNLRVGDEGAERSTLGVFNKFANLSFKLSGIEFMNRSSFNGSVNIEYKGLYDALTEKLPTERGAKFFIDYGLSQREILVLRQSIIDNEGILDLDKISKSHPILHHRLSVNMAKKAFGGTPRNDVRTEKFMDDVPFLFGKKPLKGSSKLHKSFINTIRSLQKTATSMVLNTFDNTKNYELPNQKRTAPEVLNRAGQVLAVGMALNGIKAVVIAAMKPQEEGAEHVLTSPQEATRVFVEGMLSFEWLGAIRDLVYNIFLAKNYYGATENVLGPIFSRAAVGTQAAFYQFPKEMAKVFYGTKDLDEVTIIPTKTKYNMLKRSNVLFNLPFIEGLTNEWIVEKMIGVIDPDGLEEYKYERSNRLLKKQEDWESLSTPEYLFGVED
jgi:hypothetical protein